MGKKIFPKGMRTIILLAGISLASVGYSAFVIGGGSVKADTSIDVSVDSIFDATDYLSLNTASGNGKGISPCQYNSRGFVGDEGYTDDGLMKFYLKFDMDKLNADFPDCKYITFDFTLSYKAYATGYTMLTDGKATCGFYYYQTTNAFSKKVEVSSTSTSSSASGLKHSFKYEKSNTTDSNFKLLFLQYSFSNDNFSTYYSNELKEGGVASFKLTGIVQGVES